MGVQIGKDKIYHIITCIILTIFFSLFIKDIIIIKPIISALFAFSFFTTFKETINDLIYKSGCFDIGDIKANAIGSITGGIILCVVQFVF